MLKAKLARFLADTGLVVAGFTALRVAAAIAGSLPWPVEGEILSVVPLALAYAGASALVKGIDT